MPNWCSNIVTVSRNRERIDALESFLIEREGKDFFDFFVDPRDESKDGWYSYNIENYGCKWNCDTSNWNRTSDTSIEISFESPWSPPIQLYENMLTGDYDVYAEYYECGMGFVGRFDNGFDESWEYLEDLNSVPEDLIESWNLREEVEQYYEENEDGNS